jgi:hypothetical protein
MRISNVKKIFKKWRTVAGMLLAVKEQINRFFIYFYPTGAGVPRV